MLLPLPGFGASPGPALPATAVPPHPYRPGPPRGRSNTEQHRATPSNAIIAEPASLCQLDGARHPPRDGTARQAAASGAVAGARAGQGQWRGIQIGLKVLWVNEQVGAATWRGRWGGAARDRSHVLPRRQGQSSGCRCRSPAVAMDSGVVPSGRRPGCDRSCLPSRRLGQDCVAGPSLLRLAFEPLLD